MHFCASTLTRPQLAAVRMSVGADRLAEYDLAADGDETRAIDLYGWNAAVSAAFFEDLSVLEVALRNACHRELRT